MKKIITTAGLAALGAASVQAAWAPGATSMETTKPWSVSATLRGFYDDNYVTRGKALKRDSFGFEVRPSAAINIFRDQTSLGLSYAYSMRYYEDRKNAKADHSHEINGKLSHAFSERFKADINDSFVIAQEPSVIDPSFAGTSGTLLRSDGDNMRNSVGASFEAGITETTKTVFTYNGNWFDYDQRGVGSRSALLDRWEHLFSFNLRQQIVEKTVGVIGYQYGIVDYNSPDAIVVLPLPIGAVSSSSRDNHSHYGYLGIDQTISATLNASIRGGVQYTEYENANLLAGSRKSDTSPYVDANATWVYTQNSYAQLGVRHSHLQTDVGFAGGLGVSPTEDAEATTVYGSVNHRFGPFIASVLASYQHSEFVGGAADGKADDYFLAGLNLTYEINKFLAAEAGYNYDRLDSELDKAVGIPRSFTRNRVYIGIRATY